MRDSGRTRRSPLVAPFGLRRCDRSDCLKAALGRWRDAFAGGSVSVHREGDEIRVDACDPGAEAAVSVPDRALRTILLPQLRTRAWQEVARGGNLGERAVCLADAVVAPFAVEVLDSVTDGEWSARMRATRDACGL